jgi:hypothetical protein
VGEELRLAGERRHAGRDGVAVRAVARRARLGLAAAGLSITGDRRAARRQDGGEQRGRDGSATDQRE